MYDNQAPTPELQTNPPSNWVHQTRNYNPGHWTKAFNYGQMAKGYSYGQGAYFHGQGQRQSVHSQTHNPYTMQQNANPYFTQAAQYRNTYPYPRWNATYFNYPRYQGTWPPNYYMETYNRAYNHQINRRAFSETMNNNISKYNINNKACAFSKQIKMPCVEGTGHPSTANHMPVKERYSCKYMDVHLNGETSTSDSQMVHNQDSSSTGTTGTASPSSQDSGSWESALLPCKSWGIGGGSLIKEKCKVNRGGLHANKSKDGLNTDNYQKCLTSNSSVFNIENHKTGSELEDLDQIAHDLLLPKINRNKLRKTKCDQKSKSGKKSGKDLSSLGLGENLEINYNEELDEAINTIIKIQNESEQL